VCNASCPYCLSGRYRMAGGKFIAPDVFERILERLTKLQLMDNSSEVGLYNWGEPFLHPRLGELLEIANRFRISYTFSTNASKVPVIDGSFVKGLKMIIFSMPGFSQASYDRIHGFSFSKICTNIQTIVDQSRSAGYKGAFRVHYHVYQFNLSEIPRAEEFCRQLGIDLQLHYAILNHWDHLWAYVNNELSYSMLKEVSQDLFSFRLRDLVPDTTESYRCPQYDLLPIDEAGNVLLCCQVPPGRKYAAGNILQDDIEAILHFREHNNVCSKCVATGMARYLNSSLDFPVFWKPNESPLKEALRRVSRKLRRSLG